MNNKNLDIYLKYLNEGFSSTVIGSAKGIVGKELIGGAKFSLILTPAAWISWRILSGSLSKATRKCGVFGKNIAGRRSCIARERIKIYEQKLKLIQSNISNCKDDICKQKMEIEIKKLDNKIFREKSKLREILGEVAVVPFLTMLAIGSAIDKGIFFAWRSALALFSSASRKCGVYKEGPERDMCTSKIKLQALKNQINIINQLKSKCSLSKNPEECMQKVENKYSDISRKIQMYQDTIIASKNELETKRQEEQLKNASKQI